MNTIIKISLMALLLVFTTKGICQSSLHVSPGANFVITPNTYIYVDGVQFKPSADFTITGENKVTREATATPTPTATYISRVYQLMQTLPAYSGDITIYYQDSELNGISEDSLSLNLYNGTSWTAYPASTRDAVNNFVTTAGLSGVVITQATLAREGKPLPPKPPLACYETARYDTETSQWVVTGTQPARPETECYQTATFNTTTCSWDVAGTQQAEPTLACYQAATFNTTTCQWDVTGTQPAKPQTACYETTTFNITTCAWEVSGTIPLKPEVSCYQTATFNDQTCQWDITGTQAPKPTIACYETATFNNETCKWDVTGTKPARPTTACYVAATFNTTTCQWDATASTTYYKDSDGDGFGNAAITAQDCTQPSGYVTNSTDCDDTKAAINPNTMWYQDTDGDGYYTGVGIKYCTLPGSGYRYTGITAGGDCNDASANIHPGATEICGNGIDENCNSLTDENCTAKPIISINSVTIYEAQGQATLTLTLSQKSTVPVSVTYSTKDGSAVSKAKGKVGKDYTAKNGTITIPAGALSATIVVSVDLDNVQEGTEQFYVDLSKTVNATIAQSRGTVSILNGMAPALTSTTSLNTAAKQKEAQPRAGLSVKILPNPSSTYFTLLTSSSKDQVLNVRIVDAVGRTIEAKYNVTANGKMYIGHNFRPGVYFAQVMQGTQRITLKLVKTSN